MPIRTEPKMIGKHGERYGLITFGPPWEDPEYRNYPEQGTDDTFTHNYPFIMSQDDGVMVLFSTQRDSDTTNEQIARELQSQDWNTGLIRILLYAKDQGFDYVLIDRDCDKNFPASQ